MIIERTPDMERISHLVARERVVPVLGAGVSASVARLPNWKAAVENGIAYAEQNRFGYKVELAAARDLLANGDLIGAAQLMMDSLGAPGGEYPFWLKSVFKQDISKTDSTELIDAIVDLLCPLIATTNFDKLVSQLHYAKIPDITWRQPQAIQEALLGDGDAVFHLHGVYTDPESVIFGISDYDRIIGKAPAYRSALQTLWTDRTLLFIGCSFEGIEDPDFCTLLDWSRATFPFSSHKHYALFREGTFKEEEVRRLLHNWRIQVLSYGPNYEDLTSWIEAVNPDRSKALAAREQAMMLPSARIKQLSAGTSRTHSDERQPHLRPKVAQARVRKLRRAGQLQVHPKNQSTLDLPQYVRWLEEKAEESPPLVPLTVQQENVVVEILSLVVRVAGEERQPEPVTEAIQRAGNAVLIGDIGSGKTTGLWQIALKQSRILASEDFAHAVDMQIPVFVSLGSYRGEPIAELVQRSLRSTGHFLSQDIIEDLAASGRLMLLCDNVDAVTTDRIGDFLGLLRQWGEAYPHSTVIVTTQRPADARILGFPVFRLQPLQEDQAEAILVGIQGLDKGDALVITRSLPEESRHLVNSPLTLKMMAYVYIQSDHHIPHSRGPLYEKVVQGLLQLRDLSGLSVLDVSDKVKLLALLAKWMQDNDTYAISAARISTLISHWLRADVQALELEHLRAYDLLQLRGELVQSGLLQSTIDGNIGFIHSSFAAYFAAQTVSAHDVADLLPRPAWRMSLLLWASLHSKQETDRLVDLLVTNPLLLGQVMRERGETRLHSGNEIKSYQDYFSKFFHFADMMISQFQILELRYLPENPRDLRVAKLPGGYALAWHRAKEETGTITFVNSPKLHALGNPKAEQARHPIFLVPVSILEKYHPLELAYLWVMRSMYDLLEYMGLNGKTKSIHVHAVTQQLASRYMWYREFADLLPEDFRAQLPFYAREKFDLGIDIYEDLDPPLVRYAMLPGQGEDECRVAQSIIGKSSNDTPMFSKRVSNHKEEHGLDRQNDEDTEWEFDFGGISRLVSDVRDDQIDFMMAQSAAGIAQGWIQKALEEYYTGFPPQPW
jgi:hypothetical protein